MASFALRKTAFCKTGGNGLNIKCLPITMKRGLEVVTDGLPTNVKSKYFDNENN